MKYLVLVLKGMAYGITHIIPGMGGGLILILLGIYEQFVDAVGNFFVDLRGWKGRLAFLVPIGVGMVIGAAVLAKIITIALEHYPTTIMVFFMGLLLGTLPSVVRLHGDMRPTLGRALALVAGIALVVALRAVQPAEGAHTVVSLSTGPGLLYNALIAFLGGGASVTPGLDGSYILLVGGTYAPVIAAVSDLTRLTVRWGLLITLAVGAGLGILGFSKLIDTAIKRAPSIAYYVIIGLILGSVYGLWPSQPPELGYLVAAVALAVGFGVALLLSRTPEPK
ncbi:MAG: DUF368 domain-containing protein [Chloroflexota bacterium]